MNYAQLMVGQPFRDKASGRAFRITSVIDHYTLVDRGLGEKAVQYQRDIIIEPIPDGMQGGGCFSPVIAKAVMPEGLKIAIPMAFMNYTAKHVLPSGAGALARFPAVDVEGESTACRYIACPHEDHVIPNTSPNGPEKALIAIHSVDLDASTPHVDVVVSRPIDLLEALSAMEVEIANSPGRLGMVCPALDL